MIDTDSPGKRSPSRRRETEGTGLRSRVVALSFLCGALWSLGLSMMTGGRFPGLGSGLENSPPGLLARRGLMLSDPAAQLQLKLEAQQRGGGDGGAPTRLRVPWEPLLAREEVLRGMGYYGSGQRLRKVAAKLLAGQPITVATIGGSVTKGSGASSPEACYPSRFFQLLNATFPHSGHVFLNKGVGATSSGIFTACIEQMVPSDVDLVVIEFTLNEHPDEDYTDPQRQGYEQLLRKLVKLPGRPAVVQLHAYAWWRAEGDGVDEGLFYAPPAEAQLTVLAQYYDIPSISLRAAIYPLMLAGVRGFKPDKVLLPRNNVAMSGDRIPVAGADERDNYFYADRTHPSDLGHAVIAELIASGLARALDDQQAGKGAGEPLGEWPEGRGDPRLDMLPPPMIPGNADTPTSLCAMQEDFQRLVVAHEGFQYKPERPKETTFVGQKWGWTGRKPGEWAELEFDSRADAAGGGSDEGDATVYLSHLKGYKRMGTAWVECVSGCECARGVLDSTWAQQATLMQIFSFKVTQHEQCRVRVTVRKAPGAVKQQGHKTTLMALMVSHYPLRLDQNPWQVQKVQTLQAGAAASSAAADPAAAASAKQQQAAAARAAEDAAEAAAKEVEGGDDTEDAAAEEEEEEA